MEILDQYTKSWLPARSIVEQAVKEANTVDSSGEIIVLPRFCPWKSHLYDIEEERGEVGKYKFAIFNRGNWRVQTVSVEENSFVSRVPLLEPWRGKRDAELSELSGIPQCVFVHATGFIGGNKTKEGAIAMAKASLNAPKQ
eukprot:TRINITY_DN1502_c0_g1_i2.p1 TRINITY_DN1502_c0_g1~~TRINITY_DN1502_c0_g1_i2.p1  ORF type:complete len:141 (+),score=36.02 TRINITY_DN1502_c0_g1_i2:246-668(+)